VSTGISTLPPPRSTPSSVPTRPSSRTASWGALRWAAAAPVMRRAGRVASVSSWVPSRCLGGGGAGVCV
jgi:hypothetical protein